MYLGTKSGTKFGAMRVCHTWGVSIQQREAQVAGGP